MYRSRGSSARARHAQMSRARQALNRPRLSYASDPEPLPARTAHGVRVAHTEIVAKRGAPTEIDRYAIKLATDDDRTIDTYTDNEHLYDHALRLEGSDERIDVEWIPEQRPDRSWGKRLTMITKGATS